MSTFVLVHGAWQGASTWDLIVPKLQTAGHKVFTPVLTGLGEDSHPLSPALNLDSHIEDVAGVLERENLRDSCLNDSAKGLAVSAGIITSWSLDMIAMWKPQSNLFLSCWPAMRNQPRKHKVYLLDR
jgi:hypothetical protein